MSSKANSRQLQAAETRQRILQSAKKLFFKDGYHKTTVRNIHRDLCMADGILYHYFPGGKKELLMVMIKEGMEEQLSIINESSGDLENLPLKKVLQILYQVGQELFTKDIELMRILVRESDIMELYEITYLSDILQQRLQWLVGFLERRFHKGEIRHMNFEIAAKQFMAMSIQDVTGKLINIQLIHDMSNESNRDQIIDHLLELWTPLI